MYKKNTFSILTNTVEGYVKHPKYLCEIYMKPDIVTRISPLILA